MENYNEKTEKALDDLLAAKRILESCIDRDSTHRYYLLTAEFGIKTYSAYLEFCDEALQELGDH